MPKPRDLTRRCPYCSAYPAPFVPTSGPLSTGNPDGEPRFWWVIACPACGGLVALETAGNDGPAIAAYPEAVGEWQVGHLPESVEPLWNEAVGVYGGGHFRSAVVQCGAALEGAFEARDITGRSLVDRVRQARADGWLTEDLERAVQYARLIRNAGAHGGRAVRVVSEESARGAMRFTQQTLRLLFEVPGELAALTGQPPELEGTDEDDSDQGG
jgi:Domain of unknown function (DUF4145)